MPVKILMFPCYKGYFKQTDVPIVKHLVHFHCRYEEKIHDMFVHFCHGHPFGSTVLNVVDANDVVETKCFCKKSRPMNFANIVLPFDTA